MAGGQPAHAQRPEHRAERPRAALRHRGPGRRELHPGGRQGDPFIPYKLDWQVTALHVSE
jgi:hypothetical protein